VPPNPDDDNSSQTPDPQRSEPQIPDPQTRDPQTLDSQLSDPQTPDSQTPALQSPASTPPQMPRRQRFPWFWLGAFVGTALSATGLGLLAWGWIFIHEDLSPLVAKTLTKELARPVELGELEDITPDSIRLGPSTVGASEQDPTTLSAESVVIKFDLIETVLTSKLGLDLTLEGAQGYLEQDPDKGWLNVEIPKREKKDRRFEVSLDDIRVRNSQLTLVPLIVNSPEGSPTSVAAASKQPVPILIDNVGAQINFDEVTVAGEDTRTTRFEVTGNPQKGGELTVKGEVQPVERLDSAASQSKIQYATNLAIQGDKLPLSDVLGFTLSSIKIATDKVAVESGKVSGSLDMTFSPQKLQAQKVDYSGVLSVDGAQIKTAILPLPVKALNGQTRFKGNKWTVDTLKGDYGAIALTSQGLIDFDKGYDLKLATQDVSVKTFSETVALKLPVPAEGNFDAAAKVTGPISRPVFSGTATAISALTVDKLTFTSASTDFLLQGQQLNLTNIAATPNTGGALTGTGEVLLAKGSPFRFQMAARSVPADEIAKIYGLQPGFNLGVVSAAAVVTNAGGSVTTTVDWNAPVAQYPGSGRVDIQGDAIAFSNTTFALGGGTLTGAGNLLRGAWQADFNLQNVQLTAFSEQLRGDVSGQFKANGNTADSTIGAIAAQGNVLFSDGLATFNPKFASLDDPLNAQVAWNGQQIEILQASTGRISATGTLTPIFDKGFEGLERLDLAVVANDYEINEIPFITIPNALNLAGLTDFTGSIAGHPESPTITGDVQVSDLVANRLPFNPFLTGQVNYTAAAGLNLNLRGDTDNIALNFVPRAGASPNLNFDIDWRDAFARGNTQGEQLLVQAGNFPLSVLNFPPAGTGDIGQLRGTLTTADLNINLNDQTLAGDIAIDQLGLGYIGAGRLVGQVRYANRLATLTSSELVLNDNLYTLSGKLALDGAVPVYSANLETQQGDLQNILTALSIYELDDFRRGLAPPEWVTNPPSQSDLDSILATSPTGNADNNLVEQLRRLAEIQDLQQKNAIATAAQPLPPLQQLNGPFAGSFQLNGSGSDFQLDFDLAGQNWQWGNAYSAQEVIAQGSLTPNVLTLEPLRFASVIAAPDGLDAASANGNQPSNQPSNQPVPSVNAAQTSPTQPGASGTAVLSTAALEAEEEARSAQAAQATQAVDGANSEGPSAGATSSQSGSAIASIDVAGQLVFGRNSQLTSNLQANAQNLNIKMLDTLLNIPAEIDGFANATATLNGTLLNPQVRGSAALAAATINNTPIQAADAQFLYQDARLSLFSKLIANSPDNPLTLRAQIPHAFNFMEAQPQSDDIAVELNVEDEGLALLNIFTQQVAWKSGEGRVNLQVNGTRENPKINGFATLAEATLGAQILPEPLTNVTGTAIFAGDQIIVEQLQGRFSDGQLNAAGIIPLRRPIISGSQISDLVSANPTDQNALFTQPLASNLPLSVNFDNIDLSLKDLYNGGVNGQIIVGGSILAGGPQIGGQVILSQGNVLLTGANDESNNASSLDAEGSDSELISTDATSTGLTSSDRSITPNFNNLRLTLGNAVRIIRGSQLSFIADGTLILNGPPADLKPNGTITLQSGSVNLVTTLFRLRGRDNTAKFTPDSGLQNPLLNVSLRAAVPEVESTGFIDANTSFANAERADTSNNGFSTPGSLRTIRIRADVVDTPASDVLDNIQLSSSPPRSEAELVSLIGGGSIAALERGNNFEGLVNILGGGLLTRLQDIVGNTLSLSEFNLFPVTSANNSNSGEGSDDGLNIDVGASIGYDVTDATSVSLSKILTNGTNPEVGVSYRLTDALTVRGATNFDEINQILLEYELRF
jgi:translocation and assembly module TamB